MAAGLVRARILDGVAVIRMDRPPVNALGAALRAALTDAVTQFQQDDSVRAMVIGAEGSVFSAGADVREMSAQEGKSDLATLCHLIEDCPKPVIMALQGAALGSGAEIALAAHYRLGGKSASMGFPEVALGLLPNAGATQRLPRLVGPTAALQMLTNGRPVNELTAQRLGLIDEIVQGDVLTEALQFARGLVAEGGGPRPTRERRELLRDGLAYMEEVRSVRRRVGSNHAKSKIVDCVESALLLPFEIALQFERDAYAVCLAHPESQSLRHVFFAEKRISENLLMQASRGRRGPTEAGRLIVSELIEAQDRAILALIRAGATEAEIDAAMIDFGYRRGPFGGVHAPKGPPPVSIQRRIISALMATGGRIVEAGRVSRASDIDALAVHAMDFPRHKGGPMMASQQMGLLSLYRDMGSWAHEDIVWVAPKVVEQATKHADGFAAIA